MKIMGNFKIILLKLLDQLCDMGFYGLSTKPQHVRTFTFDDDS